MQLRESDRERPARVSEPAAPVEAAAAREAPRVWLACADCGAFVVELEARREVHGAFAHTFINPAGVIFRVGCFGDAPGLRRVGDESEHWTWFAGFLWQAAICHACSQHLGWSYRNANERFVALILDRLVERGGPAAPRA